MQRGDIVVCAISGDYGKPRPAVVTQSDLFNPSHASITICPITTHLIEAPLFRLLLATTPQNGLKVNSQIMVDKVTTLHRDKIHRVIGSLSIQQIESLDHALKRWLGLD